jgi:hypothetical protein
MRSGTRACRQTKSPPRSIEGEPYTVADKRRGARSNPGKWRLDDFHIGRGVGFRFLIPILTNLMNRDKGPMFPLTGHRFLFDGERHPRALGGPGGGGAMRVDQPGRMVGESGANVPRLTNEERPGQDVKIHVLKPSGPEQRNCDERASGYRRSARAGCHTVANIPKRDRRPKKEACGV